MDDVLVLAYLAGAMDSDGYFTIKKSTYHKRVRGDANNAVYSEKIGLHQVTPDIPKLLRDTFGGNLYLAKPQTENSKPMWRWTATDTNAANACLVLIPYLRVKRAQAETLLELRETKNSAYWQHSYWFEKQHPDWPSMELITVLDAAALLGYSTTSVHQAISHRTLLATKTRKHHGYAKRIPLLLVERIIAAGGAKCRPVELVEWRDQLAERVRELNKIGVNGTPIYRREGPYTPAN